MGRIGSILTISVAAGVFAGLASNASAGGFHSARFGGEHGHPATDSPTAIYYNPAGLALGTGTRVFVEGLLIYRDATYDRPREAINNIEDGATGTPTEAVTANSGEASVSNILMSPFLGVVSDFGVKNLGVGLAVYAPFGGQASWDQNSEYKDNPSYPGAVDGVQRWTTLDGTIRAIYLSTGAAYSLPGPRLSFGLTANVVSQQINTIRARTAVGTDDLVASNGDVLEGRSHIDVSGISFAVGAGVIWEAIDGLRLGLSYQSQPGFGETTQEGDLHIKFGSGAATSQKVKLTQELPDVFHIGMSYKMNPKFELRLAGNYTRWSVFTDQCIMDAADPGANCALDDNGGALPETQGVVLNIKRDWKNTFGVRISGSYWLNEKTELFSGVTYDSNAVPNRTLEPALIDMRKVVTALGGRFRLMENMLLNASYTHVFYISRETPVRPRDAMGNEMGFGDLSKVPDMAGKYKQMIGLINLGVEYQF
jgi:long-chain fatty acid transport protein